MLDNNLEIRRQNILEFIKRNPNTTYREIRKKLGGIHLERIYANGMKEAFRDACVQPPRTFERKTKDDKKKILIEYIRKNPNASGHKIRKDVKINFSVIFKNIKELYEQAGIEYPRKEFPKKYYLAKKLARIKVHEGKNNPPLGKKTYTLIKRRYDLEKQKHSLMKKEEFIASVRTDPLITVQELTNKVKADPYKIFNSIKEIYKEAGVVYINNRKRMFNKKQEVIKYIQKNPFATQREINRTCKTHVQEIFNKGVFEAYQEARIEYPYKRLHLYGAALKEIKKRAKSFEDQIAVKLTGYGKVNKLVKTKRGIMDIVFERNAKKAIIEVKDYKLKDISISQIKQLDRYLVDCGCQIGFLICHKKPKKDTFLINNHKVFILEELEIDKIPELMGGYS